MDDTYKPISCSIVCEDKLLESVAFDGIGRSQPLKNDSMAKIDFDGCFETFEMTIDDDDDNATDVDECESRHRPIINFFASCRYSTSSRKQ